MRREQRLTRSSQFATVFEHGKAWANDLAVLRATPNGLPLSRVGFIVSKKVGKKAVVRNRVRRLMREVVRATPIRPGWDIVIIARPKAATAGYWEVQPAITGLLSRAGVLVGG